MTFDAAKKPTLLFFRAPTDGRSRRVEGYLAQVLQRRRNHDTFDLRTIADDARPDLLERLQVDEVPTLVVVHDGIVRARLVRPKGATDIQTFLAPWLR
jgi:thioredoxin-like negative regulator of GroEL